MDKSYFIKLLKKSLKGNSTKEEQQFLDSYYELFDGETEILDTFSDEKKNELENNIRNIIAEKISKEESCNRKVYALRNRFIKIAAAAVLLMIFMTSLFFLFDNSTQKKVSTDLTVQHKENRVIILPDGSTVILSPGSKLNYPSSFDGLQKREIFLYGQAFFDIKHNPARPFVVHTDQISTIVLGTAFNIRAIPGESEIIVTVKRGKVKVINDEKTLGVITPNQQITFNKNKVSSNARVVDTDSLISWKEQDLFIDNLTISEASKLLEERYKIKIIIEDQSIGSERFTTIFTQNERFEDILKSICIFHDLVYEFNKEKTLVKVNIK